MYMASIISSSSNTSLPPSWPSESNSSSTIRDVSFSSYLNNSEETYIRTLAQSGQGLRVSLSEPRKKAGGDGEIDVFGAEKYFNGGVLESNSDKNHGSRKYQHQHQHQHQHQQEQEQEQEQVRVKVKQPRTPSSSQSESSWNSQSALLRRVPVKNPPPRGSSGGYNSGNNNNSDNNGVKTQGKRSLFLPCYCCDNNAIEIDEKVGVMQGTRSTDPKFVFPVLSEAPLSKGGLVKTADLDNDADENEIGRKSLEVFGSSELDINGLGSKSFSLERRLSMLSWDAIPRQSEEEQLILNNNTSSGTVPPSESYDDTGSDASSDLFELECLSCTANPAVQPVRVGPGDPDPDPCPTPTTCYAPSEASIEWSVVTASAADFSSTISNSEDHHRPRRQEPKRAPAFKPRPGGLLLGCKSQKAVRVAGEVHRPLSSSSSTNKKANNNNHNYKGSSTHENKQQKSKYRENKLGGFPPISMSRFQAEAKVIGVGVGGFGGHKQTQHVIPSPRWSHSSHASEVMYIQN